MDEENIVIEIPPKKTKPFFIILAICILILFFDKTHFKYQNSEYKYLMPYTEYLINGYWTEKEILTDY